MTRHWFFLTLIAIALCFRAEAATPLWLQNLSETATGTDVAGKESLDVYVAGGVITVSNPSIGSNGATAPTSSTMSGGKDGSGNLQPLHVDTSGDLQIDVLSSALPSNAATESTLSTLNGKVTAVDTGNVTISSSVLPTNAATSGKQDTGNTSLSSIDGKIPALVSGRVPVDGSGVTQPVSGTFWQATQPVSVSTLPALTTGSAVIGKVGIDQTTPGTTNGVQVNAALPAGSNVIGHVITDSGSTTAVTSLPSLPAGTNAIGTVKLGTPTALTVKQAAVSIGTSAVRLTTDGSAPSAGRVRLSFRLSDASTATDCFWGSSSVAASSGSRGMKIYPGESVDILNDAGDYYAICDTSSQTFFVVEQE
jgi:hypothetical protein